jgi:hypothetical protein
VLVKELILLWIRGSQLCLTIVGTPQRAPLHMGMRFAATSHIEMPMRLVALREAVSSPPQSVPGCSPTEALQVDVVGEMLTRFREQVERCLRLESSRSRVCDLILGPADDLVWATIVTPGFLRPKPDAHRMYAQDQVVIYTIRM